MMYYPDVPALEPDELELLCHEYLEHNATQMCIRDRLASTRGAQSTRVRGVPLGGKLSAAPTAD